MEVNNFNQQIRMCILKKMDDLKFDVLTNTIIVVDEFNYLKLNNKLFFDQLLRTLYQDYKLTHIYYNEPYEDFEYLDDLTFYLNEKPEDYIELLLSSCRFVNEDIYGKRRILQSDSLFMKNFNPLYILDLCEFCTDFTKRDIIDCHNNAYNSIEESDSNRSIYALDETLNFLYGIYTNDRDNYRTLINDVIKEGYIFIKHSSYDKKIPNYQEIVLDSVEKKDWCLIGDSIDSDDVIIMSLLDAFIEYNKGTENEKERIKEKVMKRGKK